MKGVNWYKNDDSNKDVLSKHMLDGRWFNKTDDVSNITPIVINSDLKEKLYGNGNAIGKIIGDGDNKNKMKVIGVVQAIKILGDYSNTDIGLYQRTDTGSFRWLGKMMVKVTPDADAAFEGK